MAKAADGWVSGAVPSPKKFDSEGDVTSPASIALTLEVLINPFLTLLS